MALAVHRGLFYNYYFFCQPFKNPVSYKYIIVIICRVHEEFFRHKYYLEKG